jgi:hypothetical protein
LGDPGHHPEAKKSDCVADMNAFGLGWDWLLNSVHVKLKRTIQILINKLSQHTANLMITFVCYDSNFPRFTLWTESLISWTWRTCIWSQTRHKHI